MDKQIIKSIIIEKQDAIPHYDIVHREQPFGDTSNYVLVGLRRAGKSYTLYQDIQDRVASKKAKIEDILYINFEDERLSSIQAEELQLILDSYAELYPGNKPLIYLDEIQIIEGWEKFARRLADSKYRVMITGSNAKMLSTEIASALGGRYITREIFPFSFKEYLLYKGVTLDQNWQFHAQLKAQIAKCFDDYLHEGGIAESFDQPDKREYLNALYQKILLGDIVIRNNIRNTRVFRFLAKKLACSVMQPLSLSRMQHMIKSTGDNISLSVLKDYIEYMRDAYLLFSIPNFASSLAEQSSIQKRYVVDNGILNLFLFQGETSLLENMVAIELNRRYRNTQEVTRLYYYNRNIEVDFCIPQEHLAIQVSYNMDDAATQDREIGALKKFLQVFPDYSGMVITRDSEAEITISDNKTIKVVPIWKWLLE